MEQRDSNVQGSDAWHEWRNKGIGSSDAPVITGVSPYSTPLRLLQEKLGLVKHSVVPSFVMELGHRFEGPARAQFVLETGIEIEPECVEHKDIPEFRASLDGVNFEKRVFVEIKYMGEKNFEFVKSNQVPLVHHIDQIQHQFMVTGFEEAYYVCYTLNQKKSDLDKLVIVPVKADWEYIKNSLAPKELEFLKLMKSQTLPPLADKDMLQESDPINIAMARRWKDLRLKYKAMEIEIEKLETHLKKLNNTHPYVACGDVVIQTCVRKGSVNYSAIPQLEGVDLELFRKAPVSYSQVKLKKD